MEGLVWWFIFFFFLSFPNSLGSYYNNEFFMDAICRSFLSAEKASKYPASAFFSYPPHAIVNE